MVVPQALGTLRSGTTLQGRWRVGLRIGGGAATTIYSAHAASSNAPGANTPAPPAPRASGFGRPPATPPGTGTLRVAIEVLDARLAGDPAARERFVEAGMLANTIGHASVARVIEDGATPDGDPFVVLDLRDGESLEPYRMRAGGRIEPSEVVDLLLQLLDVLEAAHAKGIVHGSIGPASLFVESDGRLRVLDFGFRSSAEASQRRDARSDLRAAAATAFQLLTGEQPSFSAPVPLARIVPTVSADVAQVIDFTLHGPADDERMQASILRRALERIHPQSSRRPRKDGVGPDEQTKEMRVVDQLLASELLREADAQDAGANASNDVTLAVRSPADETRPQPVIDTERLSRTLREVDEPPPDAAPCVDRAPAAVPVTSADESGDVRTPFQMAPPIPIGPISTQSLGVPRSRSRVRAVVVFVVLSVVVGCLAAMLASR